MANDENMHRHTVIIFVEIFLNLIHVNKRGDQIKYIWKSVLSETCEYVSFNLSFNPLSPDFFSQFIGT